jgi:hypothetical protein
MTDSVTKLLERLRNSSGTNDQQVEMDALIEMVEVLRAAAIPASKGLSFVEWDGCEAKGMIKATPETERLASALSRTEELAKEFEE